MSVCNLMAKMNELQNPVQGHLNFDMRDNLSTISLPATFENFDPSIRAVYFGDLKIEGRLLIAGTILGPLAFISSPTEQEAYQHSWVTFWD